MVRGAGGVCVRRPDFQVPFYVNIFLRHLYTAIYKLFLVYNIYGFIYMEV